VTVAYWLFKSEPLVFSLTDLKKGSTDWSGVRNYQARNFMMAMQVGDQGFFYHSNTDVIGIVGTVKIVCTAYPDHTAQDPLSDYYDPKATVKNPIWQMVDIDFVTEFPRTITLNELRATPGLETMPLLQKGSRLSVQPVSPEQWQIILVLSQTMHNA
jgi:predicted RNA-binding protein with PUA-like domain